jgi:hypothetical protein
MMAVFTTRIVNNKSYLAVRGNSRFARLANMTGAEVLQKVRDVKTYLEMKTMCQLACAGNIMFSEQIDVPERIEASGGGGGVRSENLTLEDELSDFGRFVEIMEIYEETERPIRQLKSLRGLGFGVGLISLPLMIALWQRKDSSVLTWISAAALMIFAFSTYTIINNASQDGLAEIGTKCRELKDLMKNRYGNREIPEVFETISPQGYHDLLRLVKYDKKD